MRNIEHLGTDLPAIQLIQYLISFSVFFAAEPKAFP